MHRIPFILRFCSFAANMMPKSDKSSERNDHNYYERKKETRTDTAEAENRFDTGFWIGLGAVALGGVVALVIVKKKKDDEEE